jgi:hypothetical protein
LGIVIVIAYFLVSLPLKKANALKWKKQRSICSIWFL